MTKFESLDESKFKTLENKELESVSGGYAAPDCTLDTITVSTSGNKNDGNDDWAGECD